MSASVGQAKLLDASRKFSLQWQRARDHWRDVAAARVQQELMDQLPSRMQTAMSAISKISELVQSARRECE